MTIGIENTAHNDNTTAVGASSTTIAGFTVTTANALCVTISFLRIGATAPTSVTATWDFGGTAQLMTQVAHATATGLDAYIFGLLAPTTGSHTLSVTWTNNANFGIGMVGFTSVDQTSVATSFVNANTNTGTGTTASVTVTTQVANAVIGIAVDSDPNSLASNVSSTTLLLGNGIPINNAGDFVSNYQIALNASPFTLSYTLGSANWAYAGIAVLAIGAPLKWGFDPQPWQPPSSQARNQHRASGVRSRSGFAVFPKPFSAGFDVQPVQPPNQPLRNKRSAAFSHPEEGIERQYINFHPSGWEIQPPQPPRHPTTNRKGSTLKGIDGIEGRFINFFPSGWEIQPPPPPHSFIEKRGAVLKGIDGIETPLSNFLPYGWEIPSPQPPAYPITKQKYSGIKGKATGAVYSIWVNGGWEIQSVQPPTFPKINQKLGAVSQYEDGSESKFIFVTPIQTKWAFDFQQPSLKVNYRSGAWSQKTEGIEASYINFFPSGWEIQPPPPPHSFIEKKGVIFRGIDGIEYPLINFFRSGWEIQPYQPPFFPKTNQKISALAQWEDGIEFPFIFVPSTQPIWGFDIQPVPLKINYRGNGAWSHKTEGIEYFYNFFPAGWEIQPFQPPVQPTTKQRAAEALSHPEEGIEGKFFPNVTLNWGFELQTSWQPPYYPTTQQKLGALSWWEDGTEGLYVFVAPVQPIWGFDIQSEQSRSFPTTNQKYSGVKGKSGFAVFQPWINTGWEIQSWQPPTYPTIQQKYGALSHPEEGIEGIYVFVAPIQPIWGFDIQPNHLLPKYLPNARSVPNSGDDGTQSPYINFHPYGWEIQPPQPPTFPKTNTKIAALSWWEDGIEAKFVFVAPKQPIWGFDIQQPSLKVNYRSGSWSQWEDGIELPYVFVPPLLTPRGWDVQPFQPPFYPTLNQRAVGTKGKSEFAILSPWVNGGWEIQPTQPPYYPATKQKYGALSHPEEGIEGKFIFVSPLQPKWGWEPLPHLRQRASNRYFGIEGTSEFASFTFQSYGWEIQSYQPSLSLKTHQKIAATSQWEDGIEGIYVFIPTVQNPSNYYTYDIQQPFLKINYRSGALSQWEDGIEGLYNKILPYTWDVQPYQPPFSPKTNQKYGALSHPEEGIEGIYVFVAPIQPIWGFDIQPVISKINYRSGSWSQKTEGIDAPYVNFHQSGWEIQPPQPPAFPKTSIKYSALSHPEEGVEGLYVFVAPKQPIWGFDIQQPPLKVNYRSGAWSQKTEGIDAPYINFFPSGWEIQPPQPPFFPNINRKFGALSHPEEGIEGLYVPPFIPPVAHEWGFEFQTAWQPPVFTRVNQRGPAIKGKSEFAIYSPWINDGWEIQSVQPPTFAKTRQKFVSYTVGGTEGKFIFVAPIQPKWGWDQPPHLRLTTNRRFGIEGTNEFASFTFQPYGWEIQSVQPPFSLRTNQKLGAISQYEDGSESKFIFVTPPQSKWAFDFQQPPLKINYRSGSWSQWEDGIEFPLINFFPAGWEIQPPQPPHPKPEVKAAAVLKGIDGIEFPFIRFFPSGWEIQPPQPPFSPRINQKIGALSQWEDGIEAKYVFVAPPPIFWAWEIQPFQPRHTFIERRGVILRGIDGIEGKFTRFFPAGWPIQPPQPPFSPKTGQKIGGALSHPEDGIEGVYVFVPPPPIFWAWETQPVQPRYWLTTNQAGGALSQWEDGIEGVYAFVPPIPPVPPPPSVKLGAASGLRYQDMQVLGLSPTSNLYWDYGNTEDFYVLQNNILYKVSPKSAFSWYALTPNATTIYNPFLSKILSGAAFDLSDDPN